MIYMRDGWERSRFVSTRFYKIQQPTWRKETKTGREWSAKRPLFWVFDYIEFCCFSHLTRTNTDQTIKYSYIKDELTIEEKLKVIA